MIDVDISRELRRHRSVAIFMLFVSGFGLISLDSTIVFVALSVNAMIWIVRFWYFTGRIHEQTLVLEDQRNPPRDN